MKFSVWIGLFSLAFTSLASAQQTIISFNGLKSSISSNGSFSVSTPGTALNGTTGFPVSNIRTDTGSDGIGSFEELTFNYSAGSSSRAGSIRAYSARPLVMFSVTYTNGSANSAPFPVFNPLPQNLRFSFAGIFAYPSFNTLQPDSPWLYFDGAANTLIVSPASDFMVAATTSGPNGEIQAGINSQIVTLPAGMTHRTLVAYGQGIHQTLATWGQALTDLAGKTRPANDADAVLNSVSYWTDNGATYYYNPGGPSYTDTLKAVKAEFSVKAIKLGSMQLDSWWYPKGPDNAWSSHGGIWTYTASSAIFPTGLASFQQSLGSPLIAHSRWIDAASPYRGQYAISGNVATDPQYWEDVATYLAASGVSTYEQDWLATNAQTNVNLTDPQAFLNNMAASMAKRGITMQYCMPTPKHYLQGSNYSNLTSARTSQDGFGKGRWTEFLYGSQLASALGIWPFTDVFMSTDRNNLLMATLSAGPVGIGDALGSISATNLSKSVRSDGVIVKPDVPIAPIDSVFISDTQGGPSPSSDTPMVASTYSDFAGQRTNYIFAYTRITNALITIAPASYGITGTAYLYDYFAGTGSLIPANSSLMLNLDTSGVGYFVLAPVGQNGLAFLGDKDQFITMGKKRIPAFSDTSVADISVAYGEGETVRTLFGYSPHPVVATALVGRAEAPVWNASSEMFTVRVHSSMAGANEGTARVQIATAVNGALLNNTAPVTACGARCSVPNPVHAPANGIGPTNPPAAVQE